MTDGLALHINVHINTVAAVEAAELPSGTVMLSLRSAPDAYTGLAFLGTPDELHRLVTAMTAALMGAGRDGEAMVTLGDVFGLRVPSRDADPLESGIASHGHPEHHPDHQGPFDTPGVCLMCGAGLDEDNTGPDPELCRSCYACGCTAPTGEGAA